jgi:subtilisin family serine protease
VPPRHSFVRLASCLASLALGLSLCLSLAAKPIRLRNETIATPEKAAPSLAARSMAPVPSSGLFLIQFESAVRPEWRQQLADSGVVLLNYVPDDTFVALLNNVSPDQLRQLPFVRWVSRYQPRQKVHPLLAGKMNTSAPNAPLERVGVLLSASATASEVAQARARFRSVREESVAGMGRVLRGELDREQVNTLAAAESVLWIEPARPMRLLDEVSSQIVAGDGGPNQLATRALGYDGAGVTVAVADTGLDSGEPDTMHPDILGRVHALLYYGALTDAADEHSHGTHCAGIIAGNGATGETDENGALYGLGVAPGTRLVAQRIFDGVGNFTFTDPFEKLTRDAKRAGADIGSNSWGDDTQGRYDLSAMEFDALVRDADTNTPGDQPYILEFSAGNAGPGEQTIGSPAVAKNVIATGASQNDRPDLLLYADGPDAMADFSSRGPCEDGRIKPDVVAPGTWIASLRSVYADDNNAWADISVNYMYQGGTSQAGPHVAGAAAVFVQYWRQNHTNATPSPALVKAALINSATDMDETAVYSPLGGIDGDPAPDSNNTLPPNPVPNMDEGWGRVSLPNLIGSPRQYDFVDQTVLLATGQQFERRVLVGSTAEPLKITLAYTDVPGLPAAIPALVNDLDLEVVAPDGRGYHGNQFAAGTSIPDTTVFDAINNLNLSPANISSASAPAMCRWTRAATPWRWTRISRW